MPKGTGVFSRKYLKMQKNRPGFVDPSLDRNTYQGNRFTYQPARLSQREWLLPSGYSLEVSEKLSKDSF